MALTVLTDYHDRGRRIARTRPIFGFAKIVAIITPAGWTPAPVTLQASANNEDFYDVFDGINGEEFGVQYRRRQFLVSGRPDRDQCARGEIPVWHEQRSGAAGSGARNQGGGGGVNVAALTTRKAPAERVTPCAGTAPCAERRSSG